MNSIQIYRCNREDAPIINVFIHGYSAFLSTFSEKDFIRQIACIDGAINLLVRWPSEHFSEALVEGLTKNQSLRDLKLSSKGGTGEILSSLISLGVNLGLETAKHYQQVKNKTHNINKSMISVLSKYLQENNLVHKEVNFIAHSLGARLLLNALQNPDCKDFFHQHYVEEIILMGGAICRNKVDWKVVSSRVRGKIHNFYSNSDMALKMTPDLEKSIGLYPIDVSNNKIINYEVNDIDHTSYWPKIRTVFERAKFNQKRI